MGSGHRWRAGKLEAGRAAFVAPLKPEQSDICPSRGDPVRSRVPEGSVVIDLWMIPESELAVASMQLGIHDSKKSTRFVGLARVVFDLSR